MTAVRLQFRARQHWLPNKLRILQILERYVDRIATLQRTTFGKISFEPGSVDLETPKVARLAEPNNRPIITRATASFGLPAVTHVQRPAGHDQVMTMTEEHVAAREHQPAIFYRGQIELTAESRQTIPVRLYIAVNSQPSDAAVRKNLKPQMRPALIALHGKRIERVSIEV